MAVRLAAVYSVLISSTVLNHNLQSVQEEEVNG